MLIQDIKHVKTGQTRTDGKYPQRIGCKVDLCQPPHPGTSAIMAYITDNEGYEKSGYLITSIINEYQEDAHHIILTTLNSQYILQKEDGDTFSGVV